MTFAIKVYCYQADLIWPSLANETAKCDLFEKQKKAGDLELFYAPLLHAIDEDLYPSVYRCYLQVLSSLQNCHLLDIRDYPDVLLL